MIMYEGRNVTKQVNGNAKNKKEILIFYNLLGNYCVT